MAPTGFCDAGPIYSQSCGGLVMESDTELVGLARGVFKVLMKVLITGGTGSLGSALTNKFINEGHCVTIVSRDEHKQSLMRARYPTVIFHALDLGNAGSYSALVEAMRGHDFCVHTAAAKLVGEAEFKPFNQLNTNILGTLYILQAWKTVHGDCKRILYINSDKAVSPLTTYGLAKGFGAALARAHQPIVVRRGLPSGEFPPRFFLRLSEAVELVETALDLMGQGEGGIFVPPNLPAFNIRDVAHATGLSFKYEPLDPAEKLHEILLAPGEGWEATRSDLLVRRVLSHWPDDRYYQNFRSDTASRMTGEKFLEVMGWKLKTQ